MKNDKFNGATYPKIGRGAIYTTIGKRLVPRLGITRALPARLLPYFCRQHERAFIPLHFLWAVVVRGKPAARSHAREPFADACRLPRTQLPRAAEDRIGLVLFRIWTRIPHDRCRRCRQSRPAPHLYRRETVKLLRAVQIVSSTRRPYSKSLPPART